MQSRKLFRKEELFCYKRESCFLGFLDKKGRKKEDSGIKFKDMLRFLFV